VRRDEKDDSLFLIVVISKDEPTAPAWEGMGLQQPDAPFSNAVSPYF
jgi:hypothetical protein